MLKVTLIFSLYCVCSIVYSCNYDEKAPSVQQIQHYQDSLSEVRIDSAYSQIKMNCDTKLVYQLPVMVDSFLKDSTLIFHFFDTAFLYSDANKKVEQVVRQLLADCDSNLLKETYRIARLRQKAKPKPRKRG